MSAKDTPAQLRLDERQHVEKPLLDQLAGLGWEILDLDAKQHPGDSHRANFTEVVMLPVLREQLKVINPWLEDDQVDEVVKQLTANFPSTNLLQNNRHVFNQLLENTSVSENRKTGEKSPSVKFIDSKNRDNNRFIAVCQFKVRILGTEHHIVPDIVLFLNGLPVVVVECKSPKARAITDAFLESKGIDVKMEPISILDEEFQKEIEKHGRTTTKAAEIEHAIRHHLEVELDDDPEMQASFAEELRKIFEDFAKNGEKSTKSWKSFANASWTPESSRPTG